MFEHYVFAGTKRLRCGYTTGSCAALGAKAATTMLLGGEMVSEESIETPAGIQVQVDIVDARYSDEEASCAVAKDGGDDEDATDGMLIYTHVKLKNTPGVSITGGSGVGRVTKPGLDQAIGEAAINSVPRHMIEKEVLSICENFKYCGGIEVCVSAPAGDKIAAKTFNSHMGIVGGISILGTSGIVEPRSLAALKDSIELEFKQHAAAGHTQVIITPGNYGRDYAEKTLNLGDTALVSCSNFIGDALDYAARYGFEQVLFVGHIGKMVKVAGGIMDTHSRTADCRCELFCAHAAPFGLCADGARALMDAATADACLDILRKENLCEKTLESISLASKKHLERRVAGAYEVGALVFSNSFGELYCTPGTQALMEKMEVK